MATSLGVMRALGSQPQRQRDALGLASVRCRLRLPYALAIAVGTQLAVSAPEIYGKIAERNA